MSLALLYLLAVVACARITRLVVADDFPPLLWVRVRIVMMRPRLGRRREELQKEAYGAGLTGGGRTYWWLGELVTCAWCASGWITLGAWLLIWHWQPLPLPALWWPAIWGGAAWLAAKLWT